VKIAVNWILVQEIVPQEGHVNSVRATAMQGLLAKIVRFLVIPVVRALVVLVEEFVL
jgi:hypothetical protein